jgi:hypothetical protein
MAQESGGLTNSRTDKNAEKVTEMDRHDQLTVGKTAEEINTNINDCEILPEKKFEHESLCQNVNEKSERRAKHEGRNLLKTFSKSVGTAGPFGKTVTGDGTSVFPYDPGTSLKSPTQSSWDQKRK